MIFHGARLLPRKHTYYLPVGDNNFKKVPLGSAFVGIMPDGNDRLAPQHPRDAVLDYLRYLYEDKNLRAVLETHAMQNKYKDANLAAIDSGGCLLVEFYTDMKLDKTPVSYLRLQNTGGVWKVVGEYKLVK